MTLRTLPAQGPEYFDVPSFDEEIQSGALEQASKPSMVKTSGAYSVDLDMLIRAKDISQETSATAALTIASTASELAKDFHFRSEATIPKMPPMQQHYRVIEGSIANG
jgi:hypothetical protein